VLTEESDAERSLGLIERHRIDVMFEPVGALEAMTRSPRFATSDLSSVRACLTGGSPLTRELVRAFEARGLPLQPGYGLTEAAPIALLADPDEVASTPGATGRPVFFCASRLVGSDGRDVAPGEAAELWVSGLNVTNGYLADPAATSRAIVDGWLRTGDSARMSADGVITVLGRAEDDLLFDGRRVQPGPLEDALRDVDGVGECAIVQTSAGARPIVFVEPDSARPIARDRIVELLRDAGVPAPTLHVVRALPRNPNGKIVRPELRTRAARVDWRGVRANEA
jgi:fatty-acyl-CoA synthase